MTKFNPETHIKGKVYDLTQENMQAMIKAYEEWRQNYYNLLGKVERLQKLVSEAQQYDLHKEGDTNE